MMMINGSELQIDDVNGWDYDKNDYSPFTCDFIDQSGCECDDDDTMLMVVKMAIMMLMMNLSVSKLSSALMAKFEIVLSLARRSYLYCGTEKYI